MTNFSGQVTSNIGDRLSKVMAGKVGYRADLHLSDYVVANQREAKVLIGYEGTIGKPTPEAIEQFVVKAFNGKVVADLTNARNKVGHNVVECILRVPVMTRPYKDSKGLQTIVAGTRFMDAEIGTVWDTEVKGNDKLLVRVTKDNINDILSARKKMMRCTANLVTFADVMGEAGELSVRKNDFVTFVHNGTKKGVVASVGADTVKIRTKNGKVTTVSKDSVIRVDAQTSTPTTENVEALRDFYKQFLPDEMVMKLYPGK